MTPANLTNLLYLLLGVLGMNAVLLTVIATLITVQIVQGKR